MGRPPIITDRRYVLQEVVSALQKAIRRGEEYRALYWAAEMHRSGYGEYCWKRLKCILSEDVGIGARPGTAADLQALYQFWIDLRKKDTNKGRDTGMVHLMHAVLLLVHTQRSRRADDATAYHVSAHAERIEIPDEALDMHTRRGKALGRGSLYFRTVSGRIANEIDRHDEAVLPDALGQGITIGPNVYPPLTAAIRDGVAEHDNPSAPAGVKAALASDGDCDDEDGGQMGFELNLTKGP